MRTRDGFRPQRAAIAASNNRGRFSGLLVRSGGKIDGGLDEPRARTRCFCCLFLGFLLIGGLGGMFLFPFFSSLHRVADADEGSSTPKNRSRRQ